MDPLTSKTRNLLLLTLNTESTVLHDLICMNLIPFSYTSYFSFTTFKCSNITLRTTMFPSTVTVTGSKAGFRFHISVWTFKYGNCRVTFINANAVLAKFLLWQSEYLSTITSPSKCCCEILEEI